MAEVSLVQWFFEGLKVLVVFGIIKIFFWDNFLKEYWDKFKDYHERVVKSTRKD